MRKQLKPPLRLVWSITKTSLGVIRHAPRLLVFSLVSLVAMILVATPLLIGAISYLVHALAHSHSWTGYVLPIGLCVLWSIAASFIGIFSQVAIISTAFSYFRGEKISLRHAYAEAWSLRTVIGQWALLSAGISWLFIFLNFAVSSLKQIPWIDRLILKIVGDLTNVAWNMATFFVVPILVQERIAVAQACRQSVALLNARWKEVAIIKVVGIDEIFLLLAVPIILLWMMGGFVYGYVHPEFANYIGGYAGAGFLLFIALSILARMVNAVLAPLLRTALYVYATEGTVPAPYTQEMMERAWVVKSGLAKAAVSTAATVAPPANDPGLSDDATSLSAVFRQLGLSQLPRLVLILVLVLTLLSVGFSWVSHYAGSWFSSYNEMDSFDIAAQNGDLAKIQKMATAKPALITKVRFAYGGTAINTAALTGQKDVVAYLLAHGADVNSPDGNHETPLHDAALWGHRDVADLLLAHGATCNIFDAAALGYLERVEHLAQANPGILSGRDQFGNTPLYWAASGGSKEMVAWFLAHGADVNARGKKGQTPLMGAAGRRQNDAIELLLSKGADINARNIEGDTALAVATWVNFNETAALLLTHGADVNARNNSGQTPLDMAISNHYGKMVVLLRQHGGVQ